MIPCQAIALLTFSPAVCMFAVVLFACHALQACGGVRNCFLLETVVTFAKKLKKKIKGHQEMLDI